MKIVLTGGSGFIGKHTTNMLCRDKSNKVYNIDRVLSGNPNLTQICGDIEDLYLNQVFQTIKPDAIIHLAADHIISKDLIEPEKYYFNNVANTLKILRAATYSKVKYFIFSSTSAVYESKVNAPFIETDLLNPSTVYGKSKKMIEEILVDYEKAHGLKYVSLRYFNAAGSGYVATPPSHLIPIICKRVKNKETVQVYGQNYSTKDGTCIRDYTHVVDIASSHVSALNYLKEKNTSNVFNVGSGVGSSIFDVFKSFEYITNRKVEYEICENRAGDNPYSIASIEKAKKILNWKPIYSLENIIEDAFKWELYG
jgi:UDP-glucose 4-epimerase